MKTIEQQLTDAIRERDEARKESAHHHGAWHSVCDERDSIKSKLIRSEVENDQLRKVCDKLAKRLNAEHSLYGECDGCPTDDALAAYNTLPHVKRKETRNENSRRMFRGIKTNIKY